MISTRLAFLVAGIYVCFLTWGITQERVTSTLYNGHKFKYFVFLNMIQSLIASLVAFVYLKLKNQALDKQSWSALKTYSWMSLLSTLASPFGYASLKHIDYPTMILGKSCKLVPVLFMNFVIYRRTFKLYKYIVVALITAGVSSFMLLHKQEGHGSKENSMYGLGLLAINLLMDGATNSTQDQMFQKFKITGSSMMVIMNFISFLYMFGFLLLGPTLPVFQTSELYNAIGFCQSHPQALKDILVFGLCGALGQCFIFQTLEEFGSIALVTVTVTRKMFSILLSAFWFNHRFSATQWLSIFTVFAGISLEAWVKQQEKSSKKHQEKQESIYIKKQSPVIKVKARAVVDSNPSTPRKSSRIANKR